MSRIYIPVGLPGCGKTSYFQSHITPRDIYVDGDTFKSLPDLIDHVISFSLTSSQNLYLDGLFLTQDVQETLHKSLYNVTFIYFTPNIQHSLYNDAKRARPTLAATTIRNATIHKPQSCLETPTMKFDDTHELLSKIFGTTSVPTTIYSNSWSQGGTSGSCWDDIIRPIDPDEPIDLLEIVQDCEILPICEFFNYSPEQLARNHSHIFIEQSESEGDYYGGVVTRARYQVCPRAIIHAIISDLYRLPADIDYSQHLPELFL